MPFLGSVPPCGSSPASRGAGWSASAQSANVIELAELAERVDAELLRAITQWDAAAAWAEDGAPSAASWLAAHTSMNRGAATRLVRSARLLREHDATAAALASGAVSSTQIDTIATVTRHREGVRRARLA